MLRFRDLSASFSRFWGLRFRSRVLRFRVLGASFSSLGCFVFEFWDPIIAFVSSLAALGDSVVPVNKLKVT